VCGGEVAATVKDGEDLPKEKRGVGRTMAKMAEGLHCDFQLIVH
jgi:hypothetical protein